MTPDPSPGLIAPSQARNVPLDALRSFLVFLVVVHHAVLAYHPYAPPPQDSFTADSLMWTAFPIVDGHRWPGIDLLVGWNDIFLMSIFFLLSGVFAWSSLMRKGSAGFLRSRALRLGLPFAVSAAVLAPLAYYPTYLVTGADPGLGAFWSQWLALGLWPSGPAWFLWVLLVFNAIAATLLVSIPGWGEALGRVTERLARRPLAYLGALVVVSGLAYLPLAAYFSPQFWGHLGPFWIQSSRALHYAVYFFAGVGLGACGIGRGLLATDGKLAQHPLRWFFAAITSFILAVAVFLAVMASLPQGGPSPLLAAFGNFTFVLCCACSCLACLAIFLRWSPSRSRALTFFGSNAYGVYLAHYFCVSWLQLALLDLSLPGAVKGTLVIVGATLLSLGLSATLRRIPAVARVI
ncbi:MAG: acyltransferase [Acidobacteriota bacterium]|nr:acyltransferase [Acidobacteriota bacterium]